MKREPTFHRITLAGYRVFRKRRLVEACVLGAAVFLPTLAVGLALGMLLRYHAIGGWLVPVAAIGGLIAALVLSMRFGQRFRLKYPEFLRTLEKRLALNESELINAWEMESKLSSIPDPLTRGLAELTVDRGVDRLDGVNFPRLAPALSLRRPALWVGGGLLTVVALFFVSPASFNSSAGRLLRPGSYDLPPAFAIQVEPGNATVERGAQVAIRARLRKSGEDVRLVHRAPGGVWRTVEMTAETLSDPSSPSYAGSIAGVMEPTEYAVTAGRARSETYRLRVIEPLRATGYQKRIEFPSYTGLNPIQEIALDGNLAALVGARASLTVLASRSGVRGRLVPAVGDPIPLEPVGKEGLATTIPVRESMEFRVELSASDGTGAVWRSEPFHLDAAADRPPTLFQLSPERNITLPSDMAVQLDIDCLDDFGLTRLDLVYRRNDGSPQRQVLSRWDGARDARVLFPWNLEEIASVPGDQIRYHLELTDNDAISGPKTTVGPECVIRFPSLDEMYSQVEDERKDQMVSAKEVLDEQKELARDLKSVQNDLKQSKAMRWEQQEQLKDLAERQEKVAEKISEMAHSLEQSLDRMQQANLFTPEMLQKVQEINQMVQEIQSPEFHQYMQKLQEAIQKLDRSSVNKALENMQVTQQDIMRSLERTLDMLQQVKREESLDRLVEQAERLVEEQKRLNDQMQPPNEMNQPQQDAQQGEPSDSTQAGDEKSQKDQQDKQDQQDQQDKKNSANKGDKQDNQDKQSADKKSADEKSADQQQSDQQKQQQSDQQADKQGEQKMSPEEAQKAKEKQEALRQELQKLQQQLAELRKEAEQKWQALQKQMEQQQAEKKLSSASEKMQSASQSMGSCNKKDSAKFGRQAEQKLQQFAEGMRQAQQAMKADDQEGITRQLYKLSGNLVRLSQEQEALLSQGPALSTRELAEEEQRLSEGGKMTLDSLYALARRSQFITPELGRVMGAAVRNLEETQDAFGDGNRAAGMSGGRESSQSLDQTVLALLNANQQMCNGSCSSGSPNPLSRMRSLAGQQESLNQDTQSMMGQSQGGTRLSSGGSSDERLQQMAARQEMIRRGLQEVQGSMGERSDVLGRLDDLGKEMDDVVQEMKSRDVDERILQRQQKILSRLLTAQRSLRKEGEKEDRVSRPGVNPADRESPPPVAAGPLQEAGLRRGILRGSQDPVPSEFRRLVETYFQTLGGMR